MMRLARVAGLMAVLVAGIAQTGTAVAGVRHIGAPPNPGYKIVWDDFKNGFTVDSPTAKWFHFSAGPFIGDDGIVTTSNQGLSVVASGTNPTTGKPAFTKTVAQEQENGGLPGGLDHVKWLVYANHMASSGYPGFDAVPGQVLTFETWIKGTSFGNEQQPFGAAVTDPNDDLRLATTAMNLIDFETLSVFDTFLTNKRIYAFYERLPFARTQDDNYAAYSFAIPIGNRTTGWQHLATAYNRTAGTVTWYVDGVPAYTVSTIGHRIGRESMLLDHGGTEQTLSPRQLDAGMGMFTLLDAQQNGTGLVRLSSSPDFYYDPTVGAPTPEIFVDDLSLTQNRLFGEGASLQVKKYVISSSPAGG
jgi:hypothetical protein